jgi:peroxin-3
MIVATRRWFRRNRTNFAIGAGVIGAGYLAGQYILGKVSEARQRMSDERIAKEKYMRPSLFCQNTSNPPQSPPPI